MQTTMCVIQAAMIAKKKAGLMMFIEVLSVGFLLT